MTQREVARARLLGERLKPCAFESVLQYGLYAQVRLAGIADEVMTHLDTSADDRSELVRLLQRMRGLDPTRHRPSLLLRMIPTLRRGSRKEDALLDRYDRLCRRLDRMLPEIEAASRRIGETLTLYDVLLERNKTYLHELDLLLNGARQRVASLAEEADALRMESGTDERRPDPADPVERHIERVEQRIVDLEASADTARDTGPTIRRVQDDLRGLLLDAQYTSLNSATRWKHRFADAVTYARQVEVFEALQTRSSAIPADTIPTAPLPSAPRIAVVPATPPAPNNPDETEVTAPRRGLLDRWRAWRAAIRRARRMPEVGPSDLWWG